MSEPKWDALAKKVEPGWGPERDRWARAAIAERTTQRRAMKRVAASAAALVLVAGAAGAVVRLRTATPASVPAAPSVSAPVKLRAPGAVTEIAPGDQPELSLSPSASALEAPRPAPVSSVSSGWRPLAESGRYDEAHA